MEPVVLASLISTIGSMIGGVIQQGYARGNANYEQMLNEKSAENADKRSRGLYHDFQSPLSQVQQYKEAGLNPGLMFSNGGGSIGQVSQGAQASTQVRGGADFSSLMNALTNAIQAPSSIKNKEADTKNKETELKLIKEDINKTQAETERLLAEKNLTNIKEEHEKVKKSISEIEELYLSQEKSANLELLGAKKTLYKEQSKELTSKIIGLDIDNKYKEELLNAMIAEKKANAKLLITERAYKAQLTEESKEKVLQQWAAIEEKYLRLDMDQDQFAKRFKQDVYEFAETLKISKEELDIKWKDIEVKESQTMIQAGNMVINGIGTILDAVIPG